jgi:hypothetical protein
VGFVVLVVLSEKHEVSDMVRIRLQMQVVNIAFMREQYFRKSLHAMGGNT